MRGCPDKHWTSRSRATSASADGRQIQLRVEMYNAFNTVIFTGRNTTMNIASLATASMATNLPYDANGQRDSGQHHSAVGGIRRGERFERGRSVQINARFSF